MQQHRILPKGETIRGQYQRGPPGVLDGSYRHCLIIEQPCHNCGLGHQFFFPFKLASQFTAKTPTSHASSSRAQESCLWDRTAPHLSPAGGRARDGIDENFNHSSLPIPSYAAAADGSTGEMKTPLSILHHEARGCGRPNMAIRRSKNEQGFIINMRGEAATRNDS